MINRLNSENIKEIIKDILEKSIDNFKKVLTTI